MRTLESNSMRPNAQARNLNEKTIYEFIKPKNYYLTSYLFLLYLIIYAYILLFTHLYL